MSEITRPAPRWQQIAATIGCATPLVIALLVVAAIIAGSPPEHDVITMDGRSIAYKTATSYPQVYVYGPITPTTSLYDARCQAWRQRNSGDCPDDGTLARTYWPGLQSADGTLYVGLTGYCADPSDFNLELGRGPTLVLHCHATAPWINLNRGPMGVQAAPITTLLIVSTATWSPGRYSIYREDRVERWLVDQVTTSLLGAVTIR